MTNIEEKEQMTRCTSTYQRRSVAGIPLGPVRRCTREAGHPVDNGPENDDEVWPRWRELHQWMRPGRRVRWPDSAAEGGAP